MTTSVAVLRALEVGFLNTMLVAVLGILLATILGSAVGILRLSKNWLVARVAVTYVELARNLPLLLQLFFWYGLITVSLPGPREALTPFPGVILSNRGLMLPVPEGSAVWSWVAVALVAAMLTSVGFQVWVHRRQDRTGRPSPTGLVTTLLILGLPTLTWFLGGAPTAMDAPKLSGFSFQGGITMGDVPLFVEHCEAAAAEVDVTRRWLDQQGRRELSFSFDVLAERYGVPEVACATSIVGSLLRIPAWPPRSSAGPSRPIAIASRCGRRDARCS